MRPVHHPDVVTTPLKWIEIDRLAVYPAPRYIARSQRRQFVIAVNPTCGTGRPFSLCHPLVVDGRWVKSGEGGWHSSLEEAQAHAQTVHDNDEGGG